jgi:hypothetical protein
MLARMVFLWPPARKLRNTLITLGQRLGAVEAELTALATRGSAAIDAARGPINCQPDQQSPPSPPSGPMIISLPAADLGVRALEVWQCLKPMDVIGGRLVRKGRPFDGGYVMLMADFRQVVAYSLGIADDVSWDLDMADMGCDVFQYDHTIDQPPLRSESFHFSRFGIAARSSSDGTFKSVADILALNDHQHRTDLILKMDIEAAEWDVLGSLESDTLARFSQIIVELHWLALGEQPAQISRVVHVLHKMNETHQVIHLHANNHGPLGILGGVMLPDAMEVSYVRKADHQFKVCDRVFPTDLDMPNNPNTADYFLGALGHL